jgi:hypothetical protein
MKESVEKYLVKLLAFLLIITNLYKFRLINAGYMTEPDERRYMMAWSALKHLMQGDIEGFSLAVFSAQARPGEILVKTIPATLQFITAKIFHLDFFETQNFYIVFVFNFVIYGLTLWLLYKIFVLFFKNKELALFGVLSYSLLINSYAYLRHIYPYDTALLLFLLVLYKITKRYQNRQVFDNKQAFTLGVLSFFAFLVYPAYNLAFFSVFLIFALVNWSILRQNFVQYSKLIVSYVLGSIILLLVFETFSRLGNTSYIHNALTLSGTVIQGDFYDTPTFIFRYLIEVEGIIGIILILSMLIFTLKIAKLFKSKSSTDKLLIIVLFSFFITYVFYVSMGYFAHKATMYGRILHQFFPIIWLMFLFVIKDFRKNFKQYFMALSALIFSVFFIFQMQDYLSIAYPRDVYWAYLRNYPRTQIIEKTEYDNSWSNLPERIFLSPSTVQKDSIIAVNTFYFYPLNDKEKYHKYQAPKNKKIRFDKPHFLNYKSYQFEGYGIEERKNIRNYQFRIRLYE